MPHHVACTSRSSDLRAPRQTDFLSPTSSTRRNAGDGQRQKRYVRCLCSSPLTPFRVTSQRQPEPTKQGPWPSHQRKHIRPLKTTHDVHGRCVAEASLLLIEQKVAKHSRRLDPKCSQIRSIAIESLLRWDVQLCAMSTPRQHVYEGMPCRVVPLQAGKPCSYLLG